MANSPRSAPSHPAGDPPRARDRRPLRADRRPARADARPWLDHGRWPIARPLGAAAARERRGGAICVPRRRRARGCIRSPVGPVHAGIIEPGHFRFHASGETVVRLEERLGYVHKGVDALLRGAGFERGAHSRGRGSAATARSPMPSRSRTRSEAALASETPPRARASARRRWPSSSGSRTTSATSAPSATTPRSP